MSDTIKLTIDGKTIEVEKGMTVLQAAERLGLEVPRYCYHPGLTIAGNCRICLVDIEKFPKLTTSCTTQASEGMVVRTGGEKVEAGRRNVMEFLLANHPLDCPICDQAGECRLQEYSFEHGSATARMAEPKIKGFKHKPIGPHVMLDTERCIVCTRCIRFCDEVSKTGELGVFQRGVHSYIGTFPGRDLDNPYSGNTVDICPVGALTLKEFRFRKRVWALKDVPSVCGSCARGCNVHLGTAENRIWRMTPRENPEVNKWWMCDEGRLSHESLYSRPRMKASVPWTKALDEIAGILKETPSGGVAAIASASLTVEDLWVLRRLFAEVLDSERIVVDTIHRGQDDDLLIRADKTPNAAGARMLGLGVREPARLGAAGVLLVLGDTFSAEAMDALRAAKGKTRIVVFSPFADGAAEAADRAIPTAAYGELTGTWVNFHGRAQRVRQAVEPAGVALETWYALAELMRRMGTDPGYATAADVLKDVVSKHPRIGETE